MNFGDIVLRTKYDQTGIVVNINPCILLLLDFHCYVYVRPDEPFTIIGHDHAKVRSPPSHVLTKIKEMQNENCDTATGS